MRRSAKKAAIPDTPHETTSALLSFWPDGRCTRPLALVGGDNPMNLALKDAFNWVLIPIKSRLELCSCKKKIACLLIKPSIMAGRNNFTVGGMTIYIDLKSETNYPGLTFFVCL
jgi:hypothetical protein